MLKNLILSYRAWSFRTKHLNVNDHGVHDNIALLKDLERLLPHLVIPDAAGQTRTVLNMWSNTIEDLFVWLYDISSASTESSVLTFKTPSTLTPKPALEWLYPSHNMLESKYHHTGDNMVTLIQLLNAANKNIKKFNFVDGKRTRVNRSIRKIAKDITTLVLLCLEAKGL